MNQNNSFFRGIPVTTNDTLACGDPETSPAYIGEDEGVKKLVCTFLGDDYSHCTQFNNNCPVIKKATKRLKKS